MSDSFEVALERLMADIGHQVDISDEHQRLEIYRSALSDRDRRSALLACLALEPDPSMATSVLASVLEETEDAQRSDVLAVAPASGAAFLSARSEELRMLELLSNAESADVGLVERLVDGSDWLQRRVADRAASLGVLSALAERGRTRKVRARAAERARSLSSDAI